VLRKFIVHNFLFDQDNGFSDDESFLAQGIIDSTGVLELVSFLEQQFGITVDDEELVPENLDSINNLSRFLAGKLQRASAAA
jgi:acyl carrier protein